MKFFGNLIKISSTKIGQYPGDTTGDSIIATLKGSAEKGETAQVHGQSGIIGNPPKGAKGLRVRIGSLDIIISSLNYGVSLPANPGETKIYSTDSDGVEKSVINLKDDGTIEINGNTDNAVSYQDLKDALDNFKTSIDSSIAGSITGHTHISNGPAVTTAPGVGSAPSTTIDISGSKIDEVKFP